MQIQQLTDKELGLLPFEYLAAMYEILLRVKNVAGMQDYRIRVANALLAACIVVDTKA